MVWDCASVAGAPGMRWAGLRRWRRAAPANQAAPATATNKVLKRSLRAERWNCAEPVLWQTEKGGPYRLLSESEAAGLEEAVGDRVL